MRDYVELVIKNNFLESQNVQLLLNLQLQARTIIDLKNMIAKQQKFIEDNEIGAESTDNDKSKFRFQIISYLDIELFLEGAELEAEPEDQDQIEEQYASDFIPDDKNVSLGV